MLANWTVCSGVGSPETVRAKMQTFIEQTGADELMCVSAIYDHSKRIESFRLTAELAKGTLTT